MCSFESFKSSQIPWYPQEKSQSKVNKAHNDVVKRGAIWNMFWFSMLHPPLFSQLLAVKTVLKLNLIIFFVNQQKCSFSDLMAI